MSPVIRYFLVLNLAAALFTGTGYFLFSGVANFGDWAAVIAGLEPYWLWRVGLIVLGALTYYGSMLVVAREDPDGFVLLTRHAVREPEFASSHDQWWATAVEVADRMAGSALADPTLRQWADRTLVATLVDAVQAWLGTGDPDRDAEFVATATAGLAAMVRAWVAAVG